MPSIASAVRRELVGLLVPPLCVVCREPEFSGSAVCPDCGARLVALPEMRCHRCGAPVVRESNDCRECRGRALAFSRAWSPFAYEGICRTIVSALKSRGAVSAAAYMGSEIVRRAPPDLLEGGLVPVPVHRGRRRLHGFNPALEIARGLGRAAQLPILDALVRVGRPSPQVGLERRARLSNARGSVKVRAGAAPAQAVLVDDVYTTGATLDACAHALRRAGTEEVVAVTFGRAVRE